MPTSSASSSSSFFLGNYDSLLHINISNEPATRLTITYIYIARIQQLFYTDFPTTSNITNHQKDDRQLCTVYPQTFLLPRRERRSSRLIRTRSYDKHDCCRPEEHKTIKTEVHHRNPSFASDGS